MKKTDLNLKVLLAIIAVLGLSLSLMAQPEQRQRQFQQRDHFGCAMLDLTEEQKAEIKEIHLARLKEIQPLKDEISINRAELNALVKNDDPDMKKITGLVEANGELMTKIRISQIESRIKVRSLLTNDQKVIWDSHRGKMKRNKMAGHRPMRGFHERCRF